MSVPTRRLVSLIILALATYGSIAGVSFLFFSRHRTPILPLMIHAPTPSPTPSPTPDPLAPFNVLLLGYAGPNHDGGNLSDTIILSHIRPRDKKIFLISLPRDLWVDLPVATATTSAFKINAAYATGNDDRHYPGKAPEFTGEQGGFNLARYAVEKVTGLLATNTVAVNFQGFTDIISLLGGVTVTVPYTFDDPYYPITGKETDTCGKPPEEVAAVTATMSGETLEHQFPCRFETLHFDQGKQTMDAETALKFVRSRHSPGGGGDFGRSLRQQALLSAIKKQVLQLTTIPKLLPLITTILNNVRSNLTPTQVGTWLTTFPNPADFTLSSITLNQKDLIKESVSPNGQYILVPVAGATNFSAIHAFLENYLRGQPTATPSATPTP